MTDYILTQEKEEKIVKNATIVFDTSSIGQLYEMTETHKKQMMNIINHFKDRIWLPAQVCSEYKLHKEKFLYRPIYEHYGFPEFCKKDILEKMKCFISKHKPDPYFHPYLDKEEANEMVTALNAMENAYEAIKNIVKKQYDKRKNEIHQIANDKGKDIIYDTFSPMQKGIQFPYMDFLEIIKEGEIRYRHSIPPGYMDLKKKEKDGVRIYGDLVIWKEILNYSKENQKPVLFICDDVKEDWYESQNIKSPDIKPRKELIREFTDFTKQDLWIVPLSKFIKLLELHIKDTTILPFYQGLEAVLAALDEAKTRKRVRQNILRLECSECHECFNVEPKDFDFDWEVDAINERSMGDEIEYSCTIDIECPICGHSIEVTPNIWEYPIGTINYSSLECNGADVKKNTIIWSDYIDLHYYSNDDEVCVKCGRHGSVEYDGLCKDCHNEYAYGID